VNLGQEMHSMKAVAVEPRSGDTRLRDIEEPHLESEGDVLIRMLEVGVCGTDSGICGGGKGAAPEGSDFLIPGHEGFGEVVEVGGAVEGLSPGDLVVPTVRRPCPHQHCTPCRTGHQDFCVTGDYRERGIQQSHGFAAELIVEDSRYLCPVPMELRGVGVLAEPLSIAEKGLRQFFAVQRRLPWFKDASDEEILDGRTAVVLGGGPIGLLGCLLLRLYGVKTVVYSRDEPPAPEVEVTEAAGGEYVSSEQEDFADVARRLGAVDVVYEGTGAAELMFEVLPSMSRNAVFLATGIPQPEGTAEIEANRVMHQLVMRSQVLCGIINSSDADFRSAVEHLGRMKRLFPEALNGIITHRERPGDFCESAGSADGLKHVIAW
jgi:glucose 1-dehydrogenase